MGLETGLVDYIGGLVIPQDRFQSEPFRLFNWEKRFLRGAFGQPDEAVLKLPRGGGKSTFIAAIGAACVDGPLVEPNAESQIVASSFDQGLIVWRHILRLLDPVLNQYQDGMCISGRSTMTASTPRHLISPLAPTGWAPIVRSSDMYISPWL